MLDYLKQEANETTTENGAAAYASTGSHCLDLFATIGALRQAPEEEITRRFVRAYAEDADCAMRLLFFARDIREGLGERRVFRVILQALAFDEPSAVERNLPYIPQYGRWDDVLVLLDTPCGDAAVSLLRGQLDEDLAQLRKGSAVSLLGKWLPSGNASSQQTRRLAERLARAFGLSAREYRRSLSALRARIQILENALRERDYTFDYEKQPSRAMYQYRKAFLRNDKARYLSFLDAVQGGRARLHTGNLTPYDLVAPLLTQDLRSGSFLRALSAEERQALNTTWAALPDFGGDGNSLAVIDTSGSMYYTNRARPAAAALSLGLYFAAHSRGPFANHFVTFSARPQLIEVRGADFAERLRYVASFSEIANTNLEAVFELILQTAVKHQLAQALLPDRLVIISDLEFDACVDHGQAHILQEWKARYAQYGYTLPEVVFWNVASRNAQQPVRSNDAGVKLVSGLSPRIFSMIAAGKTSPYAFMLEILQSPRYRVIRAR